MTRIIRQVEANTESHDRLPVFKDEKAITNYLAKSAVVAAKELDIKEIIICSDSGFSAEVIASYRGRTPVYVKCYDKRTVRELALTYGVNAHFVKRQINHDKFIAQLLNELVKDGKLERTDKVIYLAGDSERNIAANFMVICEVGRYVK
jgi:pyruvate kinase